MHQITAWQPHKRTLIRELSLADSTKCHFRYEKASGFATHVLLFLLNVLRIIKPFENLHFSLLLELVMEGNLEEFLKSEKGNVVGENLKKEVGSFEKSTAIYTV